MRKTSVWVLCGLMGLATAALAAAQTGSTGAMGTESGTGSMGSTGSTGSMSGSSGMSKSTSSGTMAKKSTKHHKAKSHSASGDVTAIDVNAKTMTVKGEKKGEWNFVWDDKTTITPKGKTPADIAVGTDVTVSYKTSGTTHTATKIAIHAEKPAAAPAAPKTP
jgi:hypothetical protein